MMLLTAAGADHAGGESDVGSGAIRWWSALYAKADVEDVDSLRAKSLGISRRHGQVMTERLGRALIARLRAILSLSMAQFAFTIIIRVMLT